MKPADQICFEVWQNGAEGSGALGGSLEPSLAGDPGAKFRGKIELMPTLARLFGCKPEFCQPSANPTFKRLVVPKHPNASRRRFVGTPWYRESWRGMRRAGFQLTSSGTPSTSAIGRRTSISSTSPALRTRTRPRPSACRKWARRSSVGRSRTVNHRHSRSRWPPNPHRLASKAANAATVGVKIVRTRSLRTAPLRKPACVHDDAAF